MEIQAEQRDDGILFVRIRGRLDARTCREAQGQLGAWVETGRSRLVGDLSGLEYVSSAGLRLILATAKGLSEKGGTLVLFGLRDFVAEVFEIVGLGDVILIVGTEEEALQRAAPRD